MDDVIFNDFTRNETKLRQQSLAYKKKLITQKQAFVLQENGTYQICNFEKWFRQLHEKSACVYEFVET